MRDGGGRGCARGYEVRQWQRWKRSVWGQLCGRWTTLLLLERAVGQGGISIPRSHPCFQQEEDAVWDVLSSAALQLPSLPAPQPSSANLLLSHAEKVFFLKGEFLANGWNSSLLLSRSPGEEGEAAGSEGSAAPRAAPGFVSPPRRKGRDLGAGPPRAGAP